MNKYTGCVFILSGLLVSGCIPALVTAGATTSGVVVAQERSAGNAMDDAGIKLTVDNLYLNKDINDLFKNVHVHVSEGRVLLTGAVEKPQTKEDAARLAWRATGVREVINEIQVAPNGIVDYAKDTWIAAQIRSRILFEKNVRSVNYNIEVVNGVVYLLGISQDKEELNKVTYIASTTKYVKEVVSHVIPKDDPRRREYLRHDGSDSHDSGSHNAPAGTPGGSVNRSQDDSQDSSQGYHGGGQPETSSHIDERDTQ